MAARIGMKLRSGTGADAPKRIQEDPQEAALSWHVACETVAGVVGVAGVVV